MTIGKTEVCAIYESALARAKLPDSGTQGRGNMNEDPTGVAFHMTRSEVHAALQEESPIPPAEPGDDPEITHAKQKVHGKALWQRTDELVADAGLSEKGKL